MITSVVLKEFPFFQSFTMGEIDALLQSSDLIEKYIEGKYIIVQGSEQTEEVFILLQGEVEITDAANQHITYLNAGSLFGEISFITHQPRLTNVIAVGHVVVVRIDKKSVEKVDAQLQIRIKDGLIDTLVSRLVDMNHKMVEKDRANLALVKALRDLGQNPELE
ncbi:MAG: cyclic nucleotide-binding protein [Magnetococcales bacterium]|nr:cyclic nucleotide-binding protein [Magnetococcales bacterium]HIJ84287.1 cyclic nucleotide-binding domain-containing protein [Magnetococcales bacterium]